MPMKATIIDGQGSGIFSGVSPVGEALIAGYGDLRNMVVYQSMTSTTRAYNFFGPIPGQVFVITSAAFSGNNGAIITIYEAPSASSLTQDKIVFQITLRGNTQVVIPLSFGGFLDVAEGEYLNATTDTQPVNMNIVGYYQRISSNVG